MDACLEYSYRYMPIPSAIIIIQTKQRAGQSDITDTTVSHIPITILQESIKGVRVYIYYFLKC